MAEFPFLPLATDAYLGDTTHLTTIEHGAYLLLLMAAWRSPECRLPDDDRLLARYARLTAGQWARMRPIIAPFWRIESGFWTQRRLTDEYNAVRRKREKASQSADSRWLKNKKGRHANASPKQCERNANHNHNHIEERDTIVSPKKAGSHKPVRGSRLPDGWVPDDDRFPDALEARIRELIPAEDRRAWVNDQLDSFRAYWASKTGAAATKLDWDLTLHNWLRKELNDVRKRQWGRAAAQEARVVSLHTRR